MCRGFIARLKQRASDDGFSTAEWVVMMTFTIFLLILLVQGLYIENVRTTTLTALRDSARAGGREGDLRSATESPLANDDQQIISSCEDRLRLILSQTSALSSTGISCTIGFDSQTRRYYVQSNVSSEFDNLALVPGGDKVFEPRLRNLKARYYPTENAQ